MMRFTSQMPIFSYDYSCQFYIATAKYHAIFARRQATDDKMPYCHDIAGLAVAAAILSTYTWLRLLKRRAIGHAPARRGGLMPRERQVCVESR